MTVTSDNHEHVACMFHKHFMIILLSLYGLHILTPEQAGKIIVNRILILVYKLRESRIVCIIYILLL